MTASKVPSEHSESLIGVFREDDVRDIFRRRSASLYARTRVAEAIRGLAMDLVGDDDSLSSADRTWLRQALTQPVSEATEEALRVLFDELGTALGRGPARFRRAVVAKTITRTDFE